MSARDQSLCLNILGAWFEIFSLGAFSRLDKDVEIFNRSPIRTPRRFHILVGSSESVVGSMDGTCTVTESGYGIKALEHQIAVIVKRASAYATEICVHGIVSTLYVSGDIVERLARIVYLRGFREQVQITRSQQSRT